MISHWVLSIKKSVNPFSLWCMHVWRVVFEFEWSKTYFGSLRAELILSTSWHWKMSLTINEPYIDWTSFKTSTLPSIMHQNFTKRERFSMQNNELVTKNPVELMTDKQWASVHAHRCGQSCQKHLTPKNAKWKVHDVHTAFSKLNATSGSSRSIYLFCHIKLQQWINAYQNVG